MAGDPLPTVWDPAQPIGTMLQGKRAEKFLKREGARAWCIR